jgi:hypothetical protein
MGQHDDYGKKLLRVAAGNAFESYGEAVSIDYGAGTGAQIDGVVDGKIAVEVEARVSKQIRGAVLDLLCHRCKKKLLIVMPVHANNPNTTVIQCRNILSRFLETKDYRVVLTKGTGDIEKVAEDANIIKAALSDLGFLNVR